MIKQRFSVCILLLLLALHGYNQSFKSPYKLSLNVDVPISSNAIGFFGASLLVGHSKTMPPKESLLTLDRKDVNRFDRGATYQNNKGARYTSDAFMLLAIATPLLHLINKDSRKDFGKVAAISVETFMLNLAITNFVKENVRRKRPLMYNPDFPFEKKYKADNFKSFFSGHTSTVAAMSFMYAKMYSDYNPNSKFKPLVWSLSAVFPVITGFLRFKGGKHYWTDVIVGYGVGALCGIAVPYLHSTALSYNR